jgi:dihydrolipoamide dehydrogenase
MVVGEMAEGIDMLIVGGGPGGYAAALRAAQLGREVVLVERDGTSGLGGTCVRVGCIPSKALIEVANTRHQAIALEVAGLHGGALDVDLARFQSWKNGIVEGLSRGVASLLEHQRVRVVAGSATFNKPDRVAVALPDGNVTFFEFKSAVVATGSEPLELAGLARDGVRVLDSTDVLAMSELPTSVVVVGAGYIGVELGTALAKLGTRVTIVEALGSVLPSMEPVIGRVVSRSLQRLGVQVVLNAEIIGLDEAGVVVRVDDVERHVDAQRVVVAIGRRPRTKDLGLEKTGARLASDGTVQVEANRLAARGIAAIGDITPGPALAHKATAEAEVAAESLSGLTRRFDPTVVPAVVFSDPEVASVGLSEQAARALGMDVAVAQFPLSASGRAATLGAREGFARLIVDRGHDTVIGVHLVGPLVSELAGEAALAVEMGASPEDLAGTIHPHPTISESLSEAALMLLGRARHVLAQDSSRSTR